MPTVSRNGVRVHYEVRGEGFPVLFHTGGGGDGRMWAQAGYLDHFSGCRSLLLDHRGHGQSDQPTELEAHSPSEYVEDVAAVLDHAGCTSAILVGYSGGATNLYRFAATYPERARALIALGSVPEQGSPDEGLRLLADEVRARGTRTLMELFSNEEREPAPAWLIDNLSTTPEEMFALPLEAAIGATTLWDVVPSITCPTLIVCGEDEATTDQLDAAKARMREAVPVVLPQYGHLQAFWHAEQTAPLMVKWLQQVGALP